MNSIFETVEKYFPWCHCEDCQQVSREGTFQQKRLLGVSDAAISTLEL